MPAFESVDQDFVGGGQVQASSVQTTSYTKKITLHGDFVPTHTGPAHPSTPLSATVIASQFTYLVNGKGVCRIGDSATCGDVITPGPGNLLTVLVGP